MLKSKLLNVVVVVVVLVSETKMHSSLFTLNVKQK